MLFEEFEVGWGDEGEGDSGDAFELDDDVSVLLDALDGAFDAGEVAIDDDAAATDFVSYIGVVKKEDAVVGDGGDADEVLHLSVGDVEDFGADCWVERSRHHVAEGAEVFVGHLEVGEVFTCGVNEEEVVDGWDEFETAMSCTFDEFVFHGKEGLDALSVEVGLHLQFTVVGDAHGVPEGLVAEVDHG